jgi:hypothetical protein
LEGIKQSLLLLASMAVSLLHWREFTLKVCNDHALRGPDHGVSLPRWWEFELKCTCVFAFLRENSESHVLAGVCIAGRSFAINGSTRFRCFTPARAGFALEGAGGG